MDRAWFLWYNLLWFSTVFDNFEQDVKGSIEAMARRKTVRGLARDVRHGRSSTKRKIQSASPKQRMRRAATRAVGHPTTVKGWKTASRSYYRRNFGCATVIVMVLSILVLTIVAISAILL